MEKRNALSFQGLNLILISVVEEYLQRLPTAALVCEDPDQSIKRCELHDKGELLSSGRLFFQGVISVLGSKVQNG